MSQVKQVAGRIIPVTGNDIDTDRIIPARFLRCVTFDGLGENAFADDRAQFDGTHPFDRRDYQGAKILAVNANFGCGSSREHAPQALVRWGINAIVGESFAEIFFGNCAAMGVPCVTADPETIKTLQTEIANAPQTPAVVDLEALEIRLGERAFPISMPAGTRQSFLDGTWDSCAQLISQPEAVNQTAQNLPYLDWNRLVPIQN